MLDLLVEADRSAGTDSRSFSVSRPALVAAPACAARCGPGGRRRRGRERRYRLVPERLAPVREWLAQYERFWDDHLKRLQEVLSKKGKK